MYTNMHNIDYCTNAKRISYYKLYYTKMQSLQNHTYATPNAKQQMLQCMNNIIQNKVLTNPLSHILYTVILVILALYTVIVQEYLFCIPNSKQARLQQYM